MTSDKRKLPMSEKQKANASKLPMSQLKRLLPAGMSIRLSPDGEYRVNFSQGNGGTEATAYYTDDAQDALDTAKRMILDRPVAQDDTSCLAEFFPRAQS